MIAAGATAARTLVDIARMHAAGRPDDPAYVFLPDGETETARFSFAHIDMRARAIAAELTERGAAGSRVLIAYPSGSEYVQSVLGCLYAGAVAVPADQPDRPASAERLASILAAAGPGLVLAGAGAPVAGSHVSLDVSAIPDNAASAWRAPGLDPDTPAFIQYTSGSTSTPKGVVVTHGALLANEDAIRVACGHDDRSAFVGWLPMYHDMGLVANVLQPLYLGSLSVLMPPAAFLGDPVRWLRAIGKYRAHTSGGPNFAYELCVHRISSQDRAGLDLSSWRVAFNGAEPVRAATMRRFTQGFAACGFQDNTHFPCYGLAEGTLMVAASGKANGPHVIEADREGLRSGQLRPAAAPGAGTVELVAAGVAVPDTQIQIVDPQTLQPLPENSIGEVWVRGPGIAREYLHNPAASAEVLGASLNGSGPYLRTGDLGCLRADQLFITGRRKDLLIVRGQNHYPQDLEWTAEQAHPSIRQGCCAALAITGKESERVLLCCEIRSPADDLDGIAEAVRRAVLLRHGIAPTEVVLLDRGGVPKTTSGKVRRQSCRAAYLSQTLPVLRQVIFDTRQTAISLPSYAELAALAPEDRVSALAGALVDVAASRSGCQAPPEALDQSLATIGVESLTVMELGHLIERCYGVLLSSGMLLADNTVRQIAARILDEEQTSTAPVLPEPAAPVSPWQPLTALQRALWFEQEQAAHTGAYHLARAIGIDGTLDAQAMVRAFDQLVRRHAALGSRFAVRDGEPVCRLGAMPPVLVISENTTTEAEFAEQLSAASDEPFDVMSGPPMRALLFRRTPQRHVLLLVAHHLVADFWSFGTVIRELTALYRQETEGIPAALPAPAASHHTLLAAQHEFERSPVARTHTEFWVNALLDAPSAVEFPAGQARPQVRTFVGDTIEFHIPAPVTEGLRELASSEQCTLFTVLRSAFELLIHRYSGQDDVIIGSLQARRERAGLVGLVGYLVNPLPIRSRFDGGQSFRERVRGTRRTVLDALEHGRTPFDQIVKAVNPVRVPGRPALVQCLFLMQREYGNAEPGLRAIAHGVAGSIGTGALTLSTVPIARRWSQLDLTVSIAELDGGLTGNWEYRTDILSRELSEAMIDQFIRLLPVLLADLDRPVATLSVLDHRAQERISQVAHGPLQTRAPEASVHALMARAARARPDAVAVTAEDAGGHCAHLSYGALHSSTTRLAAALGEQGIGAEDTVALLLDRGLLLAPGYFGVLSAGAVVLPLTPDDPDARLAALIADSGARLVLTRRALVERARQLGCPALAIEDLLAAGHRTGRQATVHREQAAYILYTSGSTGTPKGVVVPHRGIVNRLLWMQEQYQLSAGDAVLHKTPVTFDVSVWELCWPLLAGGRLVIAAPGAHRDPAHLHALMARQQITTAHFVPSMLTGFIAELLQRPALPALARVICSGEALPPELARRFVELCGAQLHNLYGPTEASVDVTHWRCGPSDVASVPIGIPITNTQCAVLDENMRPVPDQWRAELYIGGAGLARGYLRRQAVTAGTFLPDPAGNGARLYRSGDLVRRRRDGALEFDGRRDRQVKIGGNRVEPGEVAAALRRCPGVADAVVAVRGGALIGYVVTGRDSVPPVTGAGLRARLRGQLPAYLVPAQVVIISEIPVTASGKADLASLPVPTAYAPEPAAQPRNRQEQAMVDIWRAQLGLDTVGVTDDYFALGGDSIRAIQVVSAARAAGLAFTVTDLLRYRTISELAAQLGASEPELEPAQAPFALCPAAAGRPGIEDAYPVSMAQRALLFHRQGNRAYENYVTSVLVHAGLNAPCLVEAVRAVMRRHGYLRSFFDIAGYDEPMQLVHQEICVPLHIQPLAGETVSARGETFDRWFEAERTRELDIGNGPLVRFTAHSGLDGFRFTVTSFGLDGWCVATVLTEVLRGYQAACEGQPTGQETLRAGYPDFVILEQRAINSEQQQRFWAHELAGAQACLLPRWPGGAAAPTGEQAAPAGPQRHITEVEPATYDALRVLAASLGVGLKHVLLAAHLGVVGALTGCADVLTGLECNGRPERPDGDRIVGVFNNIVPLRMRPDAQPSWAALAQAVHAAEVRISDFRRYPYTRMHREHAVGALLDTLFVFTHFHLYQQLQGIEISGLRAPDQTYMPLTAHFNVDAWSGQLRLLLDYDPGKVGGEQIASAAQCYTQTLRAVARDATAAPVAVTPARPGGAHGGPAYRQPTSIAALVQHTVRRIPDRVAVIEDHRQLSYAGLWASAGALAATLQARGVGAESVVGLYASRRLETVVALLAILRAGAAYLPLDPEHPAQRLRQVLTGAQASLLVLPPGEPLPPWATGVPVCAAAILPPAPLAVRPAHPDALACVLATSGSTGTPKLVCVPHGGMVNYLRWAVDNYGIDEATVAPVASSLSFDLTVTALLAPLAGGGTVELVPDNDPSALGAALTSGRRSNQHTLLKITPAHLAAVSEQIAAHGRGGAGLRTVVAGGEQLLAGQVRALHAVAPRASVVNEYGPTETVVGCCTYRVASVSGDGVIPIGRPIAGAELRPVPEGAGGAAAVLPGVRGGLYVGGIGLARGYLGRPGDTAAAFGPNPHARGERWYRTGDQVRMLPGGDLVYVGRSDRQIKVRGHRIELGEIEQALAAHPAVLHAAVITRPGPGGRLRLIAYWVPVRDVDLTDQQIVHWLTGRLPRAAIPDAVLRLSALPMTANAKVDYSRLPGEMAIRAAAHRERIDGLTDEEVAQLLAQARSAASPVTEGDAHG
ncbi:non-ribosomal peptide synthetase [Mycobacteroides abscessus]|uniref:non-ribosomal peptide synthetase n=1 Tax=Mycobacteroides abscessus TaxID=36809 RepID=UPI00025846A3|nr:non-ribosomal peptide synthetase [Mycobacteroides abscessus]EIC67545.1 amino acid adenylation domain-containing protein [Mycobacteroides abscessus M93]